MKTPFILYFKWTFFKHLFVFFFHYVIMQAELKHMTSELHSESQ